MHFRATGKMNFSIFQETRIGGRHSNQDRAGYVCTDQSILLVVCDGMGGHIGGDLAAQYVVEYMAKMFRKYATPSIHDPASFLYRVLLGAHHGIIEYARSQNLKETPRTTCVISIIQNGRAWWANVGDSRLYYIRAGSLLSKTTDHSYVQTLIDSGEISEEEALSHPEKNKIYSCLGQEVRPCIDVYDSVALADGDSLLLSTDGLWGLLPIDYVCKLTGSRGLSVSIPMLLDSAESVGGRESDNITAIGFTWNGASSEGTVRGNRLIDIERGISDVDVEVAQEMLSLRATKKIK